MKYRLVEAERAEHSISRLCNVVGVTAAGDYAWRSRRPSRRELADRQLGRLIGDVFRDSRETYGAARVHAELRARGGRVGKKRVARMMRALRLQGVSRRGKRADLVVDALAR
jgi:putative transposase